MTPNLTVYILGMVRRLKPYDIFSLLSFTEVPEDQFLDYTEYEHHSCYLTM